MWKNSLSSICHLHRLLMNFVSFHDFYNLSGQAAFQNGVLYMDGRSCRLCVPVANVDKHSAMAAFSNLCLAYCECRRIRKSSADRAPEGTITIVAAVTQGDADLLIPGRNGVFVDNMGNDWDATLIKLVQAPISLRQALWAPYKRMARMATEQLAKYASSKTSSVSATAARKLDTLTKDVSSGKSPGFDIGKSAGIFAAVGLAMGALGTALASIVQGLLSLSWWQLPLLVLALLLVFSGPSLLMAWLKLHKRTLGPLLEASGWAVNSFAPINLRIGTALTQKAKLPPNVHRDMKDPLSGSKPGKVARPPPSDRSAVRSRRRRTDLHGPCGQPLLCTVGTPGTQRESDTFSRKKIRRTTREVRRRIAGRKQISDRQTF